MKLLIACRILDPGPCLILGLALVPLFGKHHERREERERESIWQFVYLFVVYGIGLRRKRLIWKNVWV